MKLNRIALGLMLCLVVTVAAQAQNPFTCISYTNDAVPGRVIFDFYVDYAGNVPIVEMLTGLTPGSIFQDPAGNPNGGPPNGLLLPSSDELEFDTFVTLGSVTADNPADPLPLLIPAGALDIGGQVTPTFNGDLLDVAWTPAAGASFPNNDPGGLGELMARVTLFDTAAGLITLWLLDANGPSGAVTYDVSLRCIPEPSSLAMLVLGLLAFLRRRI